MFDAVTAANQSLELEHDCVPLHHNVFDSGPRRTDVFEDREAVIDPAGFTNEFCVESISIYIHHE